MTYNDVIDYIENSENLSPAEAFECLSGHRRQAGAWQVEITHPSIMRGTYPN